MVSGEGELNLEDITVDGQEYIRSRVGQHLMSTRFDAEI